MLKKISGAIIALAMIGALSQPAEAVLPNIFATQPSGNVPASYLDTNFTFLESQGVQGLTTSGTPNAYIATPADAWVTGYSSYIGRALTVIPNFSNTGAATINVSGLGTASIYKNANSAQTALVQGDIISGNPAILICDGTGFELANPQTPTSNFVTNAISSPSATGLTSGNGKTVTSIALTPGEWLVWGSAYFNGGSATSPTVIYGSVSNTTNLLSGTVQGYSVMPYGGGSTIFSGGNPLGFSVGPLIVNISSSSSYYLVVQANFTGGLLSAFGGISALRMY